MPMAPTPRSSPPCRRCGRNSSSRWHEARAMGSSITMTGVTGDPTLARLILDSTTTHNRLDKLTDQASTGLIADTYAGLGTGAPISLDLRPQVAGLQTWQNNVDAATGRMSAAQSALTELQSIAADFYAQLNNVQSVNA